MSCLRCGSPAKWERDPKFCSERCYDMFEGLAKLSPSRPKTLDDVIFETLVADYTRALEEWGKRTENDVAPYRQPQRAELYAESIMNSLFGAGHGVGLRAAWNDYSPEHPPVQRTPLQERLRARIAKFVAPTFRSNQADRADAYARARVDRLEYWMPWDAVVEAVGANLNLALPEDERAAHEAERRYNEGRRRW